MRFSSIREALEGRRVAFGTHCSSRDIGLYEICGRLGYDYVWIDNEHAGMTFPMIYSGVVGANAGGSAALVRVGGHDVTDIKPVLEMGPQGIIFPMVNTPEQAERIIGFCQYPPKGVRSFGPLRAIDYYETPLESYLDNVECDTLKLVQCEHVESVKNLEAILEVPGVDAVICGPMDLSGSIGKLGQLMDPEVIDLMRQIIRKCQAANMPFGLSIGNNLELVRFWIENGASFVSMGTAYDYFSAMSKQVIPKVRAMSAERDAAHRGA